MDPTQEVELLKRCMALAEQGSTQMGELQGSSAVCRYTDAGIYESEVENIFRRLPTPVAHISDLTESDSFITANTHRGSILVTRNAEGEIQAFHNVCRHRGTQLVEEGEGCAQRFTCPYHAWTYANDGQLVGVPHGDTAFPGMNRDDHGLVPVPVVSRFGFIWTGTEEEVDQFFEGLHKDLEWLDLASHVVFAEDKKVWQCNWKIIAEGGLESYHFRQAHRATIAPYFYDNLSIYDRFGAHFRTVLPRRNMEMLKEQSESGWRLRDVTHLTYALLPMTTFLVQADHVVWLTARPLAVDQTEITLRTMVPLSENNRKDYWQTNHGITSATLNEDFALGESIQRGFANAANEVLTFGRNESALAELKFQVEALLA